MADKTDKDLHAMIFGAIATGVVDQEEGLAMLAVADGAPLMREVQAPARHSELRTAPIYAATDRAGNPLVAGGLYTLRGEKVRVLREEHGAGNMLDRYIRVYFVDTKLRERFDVTNARYTRGVFGAPDYITPFEPIPTAPADKKPDER